MAAPAKPVAATKSASSTIAPSSDAKEIADLIQAEITKSEKPKPALEKEANLKSEVADLISKSLAQHTIKEKTAHSLIQQ